MHNENLMWERRLTASAGSVVTFLFQRPKHVSHYKAAQPAAVAE